MVVENRLGSHERVGQPVLQVSAQAQRASSASIKAVLPLTADGKKPALSSCGTCPLSSTQWSTEWNPLYADSADSSGWHSRSVASSTSWSDDLESMGPACRLNAQLDQLDRTLYADTPGPKLTNQPLVDECRQWTQRFPHLRVIGKKISVDSKCQTNEIQKVEEEIIASHGNYDDTSPESSSSEEPKCVDTSAVVVQTTEQEVLKDKIKKAVLDELFARVWPDVAKKLGTMCKLAADNCSNYRVNVEPPTPSFVPVTAEGSSFVMPGTTHAKALIPDSPNLEPILQVSPLPRSMKSGRSSARNVHRAQQAKSVTGVAQTRNILSMRKSPVKVPQHPPVLTVSTQQFLSPIINAIESRPTMSKVKSAGRRRNNVAGDWRRGSNVQSGKVRQRTNQDGRSFCKEEVRSNPGRVLLTTPPVQLSRHGMLPPIEALEITNQTEDIKRSTSAMFGLGKAEHGYRPYTSHYAQAKQNPISLMPLDYGNNLSVKANRLELAKNWLREHSQFSGSNEVSLPNPMDTKPKRKARTTGIVQPQWRC